MLQCIIQYDIQSLQQAALTLVQQGELTRKQPIYRLCQYIPARQWLNVECELERYDFLLRDQIGDLVACQSWEDEE